MVEWLRCSTHIYKILCSNFRIIIHGMTLDESLTARDAPVPVPDWVTGSPLLQNT